MFTLLLKQRALLFFRRYGNYLNLFFLFVFAILSYFGSSPLFQEDATTKNLSLLFLGVLFLLPLLQIPKTIQLFFLEKESSFLFTFPLKIGQYFILRTSELLFGQLIFFWLGIAVALRAYHYTEDIALLGRSLFLAAWICFGMVGISCFISFLYFRFLSFKKLLFLSLLLGCCLYSFPQVKEINWWKQLPASPVQAVFSFLQEGDWGALFLLIAWFVTSWIFAFLCTHLFLLELISKGSEADRTQRNFFFRSYSSLFKWLPLTIQSLLFRDLAILVRRGFPRGAIVVLGVPWLAFLLVPQIPSRPNPLLNEMALLFLQVVCFALGSFTLTIDYSQMKQEYLVWERSSFLGAWEFFWNATLLCLFFNLLVSAVVCLTGLYSNIYHGIPSYLGFFYKSLLLAFTMASFAGGFYLSALANVRGADANTYAMSASFVGIILALILTLKPIWIVIYPFYLRGLYTQGKIRLDHLEIQ